MTKNALRLSALALVLTTLGGAGASRTLAGDYLIENFNDPTSLSSCVFYWGPLQFNWDGTQDHTGSNSGSLFMAMSYTNSPEAMNNFGIGKPFCCFCFDPIVLDATRYRQVSAWIRWDPASTVSLDWYNSDGDPGLVFAFLGTNYTMIQLSAAPIPRAASNGWAQITWPIDPSNPGLTQVSGYVLRKYDTTALAGDARFWLDDIVLVSYPCCPLPYPYLAIQSASPGLNLFTGTSSPYDRENIRTARGLGNFSWLGSGTNPVSYSFTVTNVDFATNNFQIHLFLVPNPSDESSPDWNESAVVRADLWNVGPDSHGQWTLSYKTNNSTLESTPAQYTNLASLSDASMLGTWKLAFLNDTNITLTAPSGASTNFSIPEEVAGYFTDPLLVYFGVQANDAANEGRAAVLSSVSIEGTGMPIHDNFSGALDANLWEVIAGYPPGIQVVDPGSMWVLWTMPDAGFHLQTNSTPTEAGSWSTYGLPTPVTLLNHRQVLIPPAMGPGSGQSLFFRLSKSTP